MSLKGFGIEGSDIKAMRERAGMTLEVAAEAWGLEPHVLSGVEKGHRTLSNKQWRSVMEKVGKLAAAGRGASSAILPRPATERA